LAWHALLHASAAHCRRAGASVSPVRKSAEIHSDSADWPLESLTDFKIGQSHQRKLA